MGKEFYYLQRTSTKTKLHSISRRNLFKEFSNNWTCASLNTIKEISEDGSILLTLQRGFNIYSTIWKGLKCRENNCYDLVMRLKKQNMIKKSEDVLRVYCMKETVWVIEDIVDGKFNSGDHMLISIISKSKKSIHKKKMDQD